MVAVAAGRRGVPTLLHDTRPAARRHHGPVHRGRAHAPAGERSAAAEAGPRRDVRRVPADRAAAFEDMPVRVVDIDEASLQRVRPMAMAARPDCAAGRRLSDMGAAAIAFDILFAEPDRLSPRTVVRDVAGIDPSLLSQLPDNDADLRSKRLQESPVVLGFGLSNEGDHRPQVKAGFAFTGENPVDAPPHLDAATPLLPELGAKLPASATSASIPATRSRSSARCRCSSATASSSIPTWRWRRCASRKAPRPTCSPARTDVPEHNDRGQDRRFRGAGDRSRRTLALCQP